MSGDIKDLIINPICLNITLKYYSITSLPNTNGEKLCRIPALTDVCRSITDFIMVLRWIKTFEGLSQGRQANEPISPSLRSSILFSREPEIPCFGRIIACGRAPSCTKGTESSSRFLPQHQLQQLFGEVAGAAQGWCCQPGGISGLSGCSSRIPAEFPEECVCVCVGAGGRT